MSVKRYKRPPAEALAARVEYIAAKVVTAERILANWRKVEEPALYRERRHLQTLILRREKALNALKDELWLLTNKTNPETYVPSYYPKWMKDAL